MKDYSNLIGYFNGDDVVKNENGTPVLVSNLGRRINRRVAEINRDLKRTKELQNDYINRQMELKSFVKTDEFKNQSWFKQEKVNKKNQRKSCYHQWSLCFQASIEM